MTEETIKALSEETQPDWVNTLRDDILKQLKFSRGKLKDHYCRWERNLEIFEGKRVPDEEDEEAAANDEPEKMIVPMSFTQVMTFVTFCYMLYRQGPTFFQLDADGNEDYPLLETNTTFLERDLRHNDWTSKLVQILLDVSRCGLAVVKTTWKEEHQYVNLTAPSTEASVDGIATVQSVSVTTPTEVLKYQGNCLYTISPFNFIPDMRLPLTRWKEGRFCADECEYHWEYLKYLQEEGLLAGVAHIEKMESKPFSDSNRRTDTFPTVAGSFTKNTSSNEDSKDFMCVSTEVHIKLIPNKYNLGSEDRPVDYLVNIVNDTRVTRIDRLDALHGEFIYDVAQFLPDVHAKLGQALSDVVDSLQDVVTWLINARIMSLRQGLDKHLVVDPRYIDTTGLDQRSPVIYVRKGAPTAGIDKFIQQLKVTDTTGQNMQEAENLMKIMQIVTGISDNAMGQTAPGRRSATENRAANQGAASRMTLHASLIFEQMMNPLGRKMLTNLRQGIEPETFVKVIGETSPSPSYTIEQLYDLFAPSDPRALVGNEDFFVMDATGASEKGFLAQALQELVIALAGNPAVLAMTNYNLTSLIDEIQRLRGVKNVARLKNTDPAVAAAAQATAAGAAGQPPSGAGEGQVVPAASNVAPGAPTGV